MDDLIAFLRARLDEDEQWALAASRPPPYANGEPGVPEAGVRWQWVEGPDWEPARPDPAVQEFVAEPGMSCNLVSVETWPVGARRMRRRFATEIIEMDSAAAGHIEHHGPARVLRGVAAKRAAINEYAYLCERALNSGPHPQPDEAGRFEVAAMMARALAAEWSDHPDYQELWKS